ncbi:hypothetical protein CXF97_23295 [Pseudomonas sp. Choline-02u-1]|nr:hypothetical protein CXF97_23295 [Pseudomonas sp. Choline-02u-1]
MNACRRHGRRCTTTSVIRRFSRRRCNRVTPSIVPTLCVGMPQRTLRVRLLMGRGRPGLHPHAERGNDQCTCGSEPAREAFIALRISH